MANRSERSVEVRRLLGDLVFAREELERAVTNMVEANTRVAEARIKHSRATELARLAEEPSDG